MRRSSPLLGWALLVLVVLVGLPLMLAGLTIVAANTDPGRRLIEAGTSWLTHGEVVLQGLSGRFPDRLRLAHLVVSDPQGAWLQADDLALDWLPLQLVERRVHIKQLTAARIVAQRRPAYPARPSHAGSSRLPIPIELERLDFPRVELGAPLAGNAVALRLQGGGRYASLQQASLQLIAHRLDEVPATYRARAQIDSQRIDVQLDLDEGAGGPVTNLIQLPGLGALAVHLQLSGPLDAIDTRLQARAGALQAQASGTLDLPDQAAVLDLALESGAMSPRDGLSWQRVSLHAQARGAFTAPTSSAQLQLRGLVVSGLQLDALQAQLRGEGRGLALDAVLNGLTLPAPLHTLLRDAPIRLRGQGRLVGSSGAVFDLTLSHPLVAAQAHYEIGPPGVGLQASPTVQARPRSHGARGVARPAAAPSTSAGTLSASFSKLQPWAALAGLNLAGQATLQAQYSAAGRERTVALSAGLTISGGDASWMQLLGPRSTVSAAVLFGDRLVQLQRSQLSAPHLQANAHGEDRDGKLDVSWLAGIPDLGALSPAMQGHLNARGQLQGRIPQLTLATSADAEFSVRHSVPGSIQLTLQGRDLPQRPSISVELGGLLDRAALTLQARLQRGNDGLFTLAIQRGAWKSAHLAGSVYVADDLQAPRGHLSLSVARLTDLDALLAQPLQGSVDANIDFGRLNGRDSARLSIEGRDIGVPAQQLTQLHLGGEVDQPLRAPRLALQLSADARLHGSPVKLAATATGPIDALQLHASAASSGETDTASQLAAAGTWYEDRRELKLTSLSAHYQQQNLRLLSPALLSLRDGVAVDQLRLGIATTVLQLQGELIPRLDLQASVRNLTPAVLGLVVPGLQAQGHADADLQLHGSLSDPSGSFTLSAAGLSPAGAAGQGLPAAAIKLQAQLAAGAADIDMAVDSGDQMQLTVSGRVPLHPSGALGLKLSGRMNLSLANPILEASGQRLLGELTVQAQLSGTLAAPQALGQFTLTHGDLQDYARGLHISNISMSLNATGSQLQLKELRGNAGSGTISASGSVNLSAPGMPVQLQFTAHAAQPLKSDLLTANLDADLRVSGALLRREGSASGTVHVINATINIPKALPPSVAVLNVIRPGQQPPPPRKPLLARLDLTINAPRGVFVRGRGLNVQVGGTAHITGTGTHPNVGGGFDLINGTFDMAGSTLTFTSGRLSFNGTGLHHQIDPTLDFTATTYAGSTTATLHVGGYADAPVITLSSTPPLPQDQILAELLFGENASQLTPLQAAGIAAALVTVSGAGGGGFNPLNSVQHALGLNRLVISSGTPSTTSATGQSSGGATIQAGRYVSSRFYVGAKQSTNGLSQAQVQVDLTRQWKLQSTLSNGGGTVQGATPENDPGSSVGMSYQFQY